MVAPEHTTTAAQLAESITNSAVLWLIITPVIVACVTLLLAFAAAMFLKNGKIMTGGGIVAIIGILTSLVLVNNHNVTEYYEPFAATVTHDIVDAYLVQEAIFDATPENAKRLTGDAEEYATIELLLNDDQLYTYSITVDDAGDAVLVAPLDDGASAVENLQK